MNSDILIYMNDRVVALTDSEIASRSTNSGRVRFFESPKVLARQLKRFEESGDERMTVVHRDLKELFAHVAGCFKCVEAAGGLVTLPDGRILFIERLGKWDLPKGKAQKGEALQETAIREVMEECGLKTAPKIAGEQTHTYHTYHQNGRHILKHTAWFAMCYDGDESLRPQHEEDISQAVWLHESHLEVVAENTYASIKQVLRDFGYF